MEAMSELNVKVADKTVGDIVPADDGRYQVKGLKEVWFTTPEDAQQAILERRENLLRLAQEAQEKRRNIRVKIGKSLFEAMVERGLWVGRPLEETRTQTTLELEDADHLRVGLSALIDALERDAKQATRRESTSMRARALIGAAKQHLARI